MEENIEEGMVKNGRVEVGKTPSVHSGAPSEMIKQGEAITQDEENLDVMVQPDVLPGDYTNSSQFLKDLLAGDI